MATLPDDVLVGVAPGSDDRILRLIEGRGAMSVAQMVDAGVSKSMCEKVVPLLCRQHRIVGETRGSTRTVVVRFYRLPEPDER